MVMNRKEQAYVEELETRLVHTRALCFTPRIAPDIHPDNLSNGQYVNGYIFNAHTHVVSPACTSTDSHSNHKHYTPKPGDRYAGSGFSQRGISLYTTRLDALRGLRNHVEQEAAATLHSIDMMIAEESKIQTQRIDHASSED